MKGFATELKSLFRSQSDFIITNLQERFSATDKLNNTLGTADQLPILPPPALEASTDNPTDDDFSFGIASIEEVNDIQEQRESTEKVSVKENSLIPQDKLTQFFVRSCSRRNMATKLVAHLIDEETRKKSNVAGKKGKQKLDPNVIEFVKEQCFYYWPLTGQENEEDSWKLCKVSIDENSRSLINKPRKFKRLSL